jgi:nucleoside triphosphate diphosphatase
VLRKLDEEVAELKAELPEANPERLADEVGDLLFVLANLARKLGLEPEECLRRANRKFVNRFQCMDKAAGNKGFSLAEMPLDAMEEIWREIKHNKVFGT